mgnify:CR=1 FL=1
MKLFGSSFSPYVRKIMILCAEAGIAYEAVQIGIGDPDPAFRAASPLGKMPAIEDDGFHLADSSAIAHYLDARHGAGFIPADPQARGRAIWFDEFADTELFGALQPMFFNRVVAPFFLRREADEEAAVAAERDRLPKVLDYLEAVLPNAGQPLAGDRFGLADASVASAFVNLDHCRRSCSLDGWPRLSAWIAAAHARPAIAPIIAREQAILTKIGAATAPAA